MSDRLNIVLLIDALGWEIVQRFDFCAGMLDVRRPLGTVFGYSSAAIPSLLSGALPSQHGVWSMYRLAGPGATFRALRHVPSLPHALDWRARRIMRRWLARRDTIANYYDLYEIPLDLLSNFDVALKTDPYLPGGLSCTTVFDEFVRSGVDYRLWYHRSPESSNMEAFTDAVGGGDEVLFLYTAELDALMHRVGSFHESVGEKLRCYESFLRGVVERAEKSGRSPNICVLSDHGMTDVTATIDPWGELRRRGFRLKRDYLAFFDSTMARFWCDGAVRDAVSDIAERSGCARVLSDDELQDYGCYFADNAYGNTILLADPGVMVVPSFMGSQALAAMHGYDPNDQHSIGCFLTNDATTPAPESILGFKRFIASSVHGVGA